VKTLNLSPWKKGSVRAGLGLILNVLAVLSSNGQCSNSLNARVYDTLITGIGYGNYTLTFPQWNPDSGTLMSVRIGARVNLAYGFTLKNADVVPSVYTIFVGRIEQISSAALSTPYSHTFQQNIGVFPLNPGDQVSEPPFPFQSNYTSTDTIAGAVAAFIGIGSLSFDYAPITYTDIHTNNNSSYSYGATARDTVHFSLTYSYCTAGTLASSLLRFDALADPGDAGTVRLSWTAVNEAVGRVYQVEESRDGAHFVVAGSVAGGVAGGGGGGNDYSYTVKLPPGSQGKWYFRLQMIDPGAGSSYSEIKAVTMGDGDAGRGILLYPDPTTDYINIVFDPAAGAGGIGSAGAGSSVGGSRQVDVFAADGRLVQRAYFSLAATTGRINFQRSLAAGAYFVRVEAPQVKGSHAASFLVR
jgi:hypothetical protein